MIPITLLGINSTIGYIDRKDGSVVVSAGPNGEIIGRKAGRLVFKIIPAKVAEVSSEAIGGHFLSFLINGNEEHLDIAINMANSWKAKRLSL